MDAKNTPKGTRKNFLGREKASTKVEEESTFFNNQKSSEVKEVENGNKYK